MPYKRYTALFHLFISGACFGYAPAAASWTYVDYFLYSDGLFVGGLVSSILSTLIIARKTTFQCVIWFNFVFIILWILGMISLPLPTQIVDFALGACGGIASGMVFASIPWIFFHSCDNIHSLYLNLISPMCFCAGISTVYFCISQTSVCYALLILMVIFLIYWIGSVGWEQRGQRIKTQEMSKLKEFATADKTVLPNVSSTPEPYKQNLGYNIAEDVLNKDDRKPLNSMTLLVLLGLQPLSAIFFLPLLQLICMNLADNPWVCYRNHSILQLLCVSVGSWCLHRLPKFSLLPITSFILAALYFMLAICSQVSMENNTQRCNELSLGFVMFMITLASSLGWYQLPFMVSFELYRQGFTLKRVGLSMSIWWLSSYLANLTIRALSNEIRLSAILTSLSLLCILLATVTSYLQIGLRG